MSIKANIKLVKTDQGWSMVILEPERVKEQCVDKFIKHENTVSVILSCEIKRPFTDKSLSQLGYLHAAVFPVFYQQYIDQGIQIITKEQEENVRDAIKYAISFIVEVPDIKGGVHYKPKSLAGASKEEVSEFIEAVIRLAAEFSLIVPSPDEYLKQHDALKFEE